MAEPAASVVAALEELGLPYRVITHDTPVRSLAEAAAARGVDVVDVVKTLVVRRGDDDYLFVLVPGGRAISWPKLRERQMRRTPRRRGSSELSRDTVPSVERSSTRISS